MPPRQGRLAPTTEWAGRDSHRAAAARPKGPGARLLGEVATLPQHGTEPGRRQERARADMRAAEPDDVPRSARPPPSSSAPYRNPAAALYARTAPLDRSSVAADAARHSAHSVQEDVSDP